MTVILTKLLIASVFGFAFLAPFALTYLITNWLLRRKDREVRERDYAQANATNEGMPEYLGRWPDDFQPKG